MIGSIASWSAPGCCNNCLGPVLFFAVGGWSWVVWGIAVRIAVSLTGHWLVVRFTHQGTDRPWLVDGAAVQGVNIGTLSLITFGESWHSNHHAYPESARMGIEPGQPDPGWWLIRALQLLGLADGVKQPADLAPRTELRRAGTQSPNRPLARKRPAAVGSMPTASGDSA